VIDLFRPRRHRPGRRQRHRPGRRVRRHLVASQRNAEAVAELEKLGATAIGVQCDVSDEDNVACASERRSTGSIAWPPTPRR
jgi:ribonuclease PH